MDTARPGAYTRRPRVAQVDDARPRARLPTFQAYLAPGGYANGRQFRACGLGRQGVLPDDTDVRQNRDVHTLPGQDLLSQSAGSAPPDVADQSRCHPPIGRLVAGHLIED